MAYEIDRLSGRVLSIDDEVNLPPGSFIVYDVRACLLKGVVSCQQSLVLDVISASQEVNLCAHICEVVHEVDVLISGFPVR